MQTLQHLVVPEDFIWPTVSHSIGADCPRLLLLSWLHFRYGARILQISPQKYLVWRQCSVLELLKIWVGVIAFHLEEISLLNVCGLRPHHMSWAGLGDFQEAIGYCRRQCLVTQLLACSLRLSCFLQCLRTQSHTVTGHAALWLRHITQAFLLCKQCSCRKTGYEH